MNRLLQHIKDYLFRGVKLGAIRSVQWSSFRKENIGKECRACGQKGTLLKPLELHHSEPYNINPSRELDKTNIITLCRTCHFLIGHLKNFKTWNININEDAQTLRDKIKNRP